MKNFNWLPFFSTGANALVAVTTPIPALSLIATIVAVLCGLISLIQGVCKIMLIIREKVRGRKIDVLKELTHITHELKEDIEEAQDAIEEFTADTSEGENDDNN